MCRLDMFTVNSKVLNIIDNVWFCTVTIEPRTPQPHTTTTLVNKFTCVGLTCSLSIVEDQVTDNSTSYVSLKNTNSYTKLQFTRLIQQHLFGKIKSSTIYQKKIHTIEITIHPHQSQAMTMTLQYKTNPIFLSKPLGDTMWHNAMEAMTEATTEHICWRHAFLIWTYRSDLIWLAENGTKLASRYASMQHNFPCHNRQSMGRFVCSTHASGQQIYCHKLDYHMERFVNKLC